MLTTSKVRTHKKWLGNGPCIIKYKSTDMESKERRLLWTVVIIEGVPGGANESACQCKRQQQIKHDKINFVLMKLTVYERKIKSSKATQNMFRNVKCCEET